MKHGPVQESASVPGATARDYWTKLAVAKSAAGIGTRNRHVIAIGRSPLIRLAWPMLQR